MPAVVTMRRDKSDFVKNTGGRRTSHRRITDYSFIILKSFGPVTWLSLTRFRSLPPVLALFALIALSGASATFAQSSNQWNARGWVSSSTIYDMTGNANMNQNSPLIAGHSYNLTLVVTVPNTSVSTKTFDLSLNNFLTPSTAGQSGTYWAVHNPSYGGFNQSGFVPGDKSVTFNYVQGILKVSAYFEVPVNFTIPIARYSTPSGNGTLTLHLPQDGVVLASVVPAGSTSTGFFSASIEDQTVQAYLNDYNQTSNYVPAGKIPSTYSSLVNSILAEAQALDKLGLASNGTALLSVVVPSAFPTPPSSTLQTYLLGGLAAAVIVIVLLLVFTLRSRGKSGYSTGIINEVQKDLAVLEVTAAKYDKAMADKLKSLRDKLSESS